MESHKPDPAFLACRNCVCAAMRRASRAVTQHYERSFRGSDLRATQFTLLSVLTQTGPLPVSSLATHAGLERTTLTRNLQLLEKRGFVRVGNSGEDQRIRQVELTRAGYAAAAKGLSRWKAAQAGVAPILRRYQMEKWMSNVSG
jgi:DNA-binding MarR family transcriptional regulator